MNWSQFRGTILDSPFIGTWEVKFGESFYQDKAMAAVVRIKVPPETRDPAGKRVELALKDEEVLFECQTYSTEHGINGDHDLEGIIKLLSYLFPGIAVFPYPPLPANHRPPHRFELSPPQLQIFESTNISKTPVAPLFGQEREYFGSTVLELNSNPDMGQDGEWPVRYRQGWIEKISCPFCPWSGYSSIEAVSLRYPEQVRYSSEYLILICPRCERAIESILYQ